MHPLILMFACYCGGIIASIGFMFAGMSRDNNLKSAGLFTYFYAFTCCVAWPLTILQQMTTKDEA